MILQRPLHSHLATDLDASTIRVMWRGTTTRRRQRQQAQRLRALLGSFVIGVAAALCVVGLAGRERPAAAPAHVDPVTKTLKLAGGGDFDTLQTPEGQRAIAFDDGSRIELDRGASIRALENTDHSLALLLDDGRVRFDIHPGGPRRWSIEAGLATVEVVGTRFTVTRAATAVIIEVEHGVVLVRGERVLDRVQRLTAGERLTVAQERVPPAASAATAPNPAAQVARSGATTQEPTWHALADQGAYSEAYESLGAQGIAAQVGKADLAQLLALADVARLSGHPADAVEPLRRIVAEHANDPRVALAAFTLGRIHLDDLGSPSSAVRDFREAIARKLANALLEDAYLRWIEAAAKSGDRAEVREAYEHYRAQFPNSKRQSTAERWAGKH